MGRGEREEGEEREEGREDLCLQGSGRGKTRGAEVSPQEWKRAEEEKCLR